MTDGFSRWVKTFGCRREKKLSEVRGLAAPSKHERNGPTRLVYSVVDCRRGGFRHVSENTVEICLSRFLKSTRPVAVYQNSFASLSFQI